MLRCSKESSQRDGSFEHPKHMLRFMGKKTFKFFTLNFFVNLNLWSRLSHLIGLEHKIVNISNIHSIIGSNWALPPVKLGRSDSQIGRSYSAKLQHFLSV